jgi:nucleotide-binding universal stress UspA family protein
MFERILVPLDGSALAECTIGHALRLAKAFESELHLLTVIEPQPVRDPVDSMQWRMARAEARGYLKRVAERLRDEDLTVEAHVREGKASEHVVDCAWQLGTDLVLLSRHARGGLTAFSMSGTAFKVVTGSEISVLLLETESVAPRDRGYRTVLAPVDCSRRSEWSAHLAARIARSAGGELVLATVVPAPELLGDAIEWSEQVQLARRLIELNRETAEHHLGALKEQLSTGGLRVRIRVTEDPHVAPALQQLSEDEDASLVVIAAHGNSGHPGWSYGSVAVRLVNRIRRPLIVFQDLAGSHESLPSRRWRTRNRVRRHV